MVLLFWGDWNLELGWSHCQESHPGLDHMNWRLVMAQHILAALDNPIKIAK